MNLLDVLYVPAAVVTAPWWARKTRSGWGERFGHIDALPAKRPGVPRILLHAVSVGEVGTLRSLVPLLVEGGAEVVVSASTDTGLVRARELYEHQAGGGGGGGGGVHVTRYALDFSPAVQRFLNAVQPDAVGLVELEVWPNFIRACVKRGVPVGVINGRLSARSFRGYSKVRRWMRPLFESLAFACVQDADYAQRFKAMGVNDARLHVTGSMKWDATPVVSTAELDRVPGAVDMATQMGIDRGRPLIVAGSTAPISGKESAFASEDAMLHAACPSVVQLMCAPRRPEHRDAAHLALGGSACVRRSSRVLAPPGTSRYLLDTIGELRGAYALADVCVIGRTFGTLGGSDPIESIALGKPTVLGPDVANFSTIVDTFERAGAVVRADERTLPGVLRALLESAERRAELAERGRACIIAQQGATRRHAAMLLGLVNVPGPRA